MACQASIEVDVETACADLARKQLPSIQFSLLVLFLWNGKHKTEQRINLWEPLLRY